MASPDLRTASRAGELTVEHVTNTLGHIEAWIGAVRAALGGLPPGMSLPSMDELSPATSAISALRVRNNCPPPRPTKKKPTKKK